MENSTANIIEIENLSRYFQDKAALKNVSIQVPRGQVLAIIGENGAGKTTLIKHILGLLKAQQGSVSVFGMNPVIQPKEVLSRIGYLSEQPDLPEWMTIAQLMNYMQSFYEAWDKAYASQLLEMFSLDPGKKIKELSKGQRARVGLCTAQAHRPELLLLDEPSSGLDPLARKDILAAIIRTVVDEGRSVLLSSHFLEEVERVCDHLVMFSQGEVLMSEDMDSVLANHFQITLRGSSQQAWENLPGVIRASEEGGEWRLSCFGDSEQLSFSLQEQGAEILEKRALTLNEAFIARSPAAKILDEVA